MRLSSDTFAQRRLTVTPVEVSIQISNKYYVFNFLVYIRVVTFNISRRINHTETNFNTTIIIYPTRMWRQVISRRSDKRSGDFTSCYRGRLSKGNLQGHTPWVLIWIPSRATSTPTAQFKKNTSVIVVMHSSLSSAGGGASLFQTTHLFGSICEDHISSCSKPFLLNFFVLTFLLQESYCSIDVLFCGRYSPLV